MASKLISNVLKYCTEQLEQQPEGTGSVGNSLTYALNADYDIDNNIVADLLKEFKGKIKDSNIQKVSTALAFALMKGKIPQNCQALVKKLYEECNKIKSDYGNLQYIGTNFKDWIQ